MHDLNTQFANAAVTYRNSAAQLDEEARELDAELDSPYGRIPGGSRLIQGKIDRCRAEAAHWRRMAEAADEGIHLVEPNPVGPAVERFPDLAAEASKAGRVRYVNPVGGPGVNRFEEPVR